MNYTYILKCADGTLYCGWTNDLEKRVRAHNEGKGAKVKNWMRIDFAYILPFIIGIILVYGVVSPFIK